MLSSRLAADVRLWLAAASWLNFSSSLNFVKCHCLVSPSVSSFKFALPGRYRSITAEREAG
jgi:hypothetical protein